MSSSHRNAHSDAAKKEQIVTEFFAKSLHIILEARSPFVSSRNYSGDQTASSPSSSSSSSSSYHRPRDKWFNLALQDCPAALENIDFWRQSNLEPMIVDVILVDQQKMNFSPKELFRNSSGKEQEGFTLEERHEKVIERWVVKYENQKSRHSTSGSRRSGLNLHEFYKKLLLLLRSLYSTVRLLPAYKLFRDIISSGQIQAFILTHRLRSFMEPFAHREETHMQRFGFTPVDGSCGRLSVSVSYKHSLSDLGLHSPSTPISPRIIPDYVGSPLTEFKRSSLPVSHSSPSYSPITRHRSWSPDISHPSPTSNYPSPYPTYKDYPSSVPRAQRPPPMSLPPNTSDVFHTKYGSAEYDEGWPPLASLTSTSISPPTCLPRRIQPRTLSLCESAPVRMPPGTQHVALGSPAKQGLPPFSPVRQTRPGEFENDRGFDTGVSAAEKSEVGRDECGRSLGARSSSNAISRSSSRLDYDDLEFVCPFVVDEDEDDEMDPLGRDRRSQSREPSGAGAGLALARKSQDTAVGALVLMLNKASPLHLDSSSSTTPSLSKINCSNTAQDPHRMSQELSAVSSVTSVGQLMSKTTALALEELRGYREMKESLLKQGSWAGRSLDKDKDTSAEDTFKFG
ncbi:Autophagy-related protein [Drosera capensis]